MRPSNFLKKPRDSRGTFPVGSSLMSNVAFNPTATPHECQAGSKRVVRKERDVCLPDCTDLTHAVNMSSRKTLVSQGTHVDVRNHEEHSHLEKNILNVAPSPSSQLCKILIFNTETPRLSTRTNTWKDMDEDLRHAQTGAPSALRSNILSTYNSKGPYFGVLCTLLMNAKPTTTPHSVRLYHSKDWTSTPSKSTSCQPSSGTGVSCTVREISPDTQLTHTDAQGRATMVDVGGKAPTSRTASACATVLLGPTAFRLLRENQLAKGDAMAVAQLAGIMASKQTATLIPLCHPLPLDHSSVAFRLDEPHHAVVITATCRTAGRTGVEMEALTAASVAALTVYDMCKAVSHDIIITDIKLLSKTGGKKDFCRNLSQAD